jgi:hypothetical protein
LPSSKVFAFEAALPHRGNCFSMDHEGDARLTLSVPPEFITKLSEVLPRLTGRTFVVGISLKPLD